VTAGGLVRAAHPEPVVAVTLISAALAYSAGRGAVMTALCGAAVLSGQLFIGWSNDILDANLDAEQGRTDKPIAAGLLPLRTARIAAGIAVVACVPLSLAVGTGSALAHFAGLGAATAYNARLKRTSFSVLAYAVAFAMVPAFVTLGPPITHFPAWWATGAAAIAGTAGHFTQALPDIARDRRSGVLGLPQRLGERPTALLAVLLMVIAAGLVVVGAPSGPLFVAFASTVVLMAAVLATVLRGRLRIAFRLAMVSAGLVVGALVLAGGRF
jgi:4-hydroxybenzoate polyprenyltransferase